MGWALCPALHAVEPMCARHASSLLSFIPALTSSAECPRSVLTQGLTSPLRAAREYEWPESRRTMRIRGGMPRGIPRRRRTQGAQSLLRGTLPAPRRENVRRSRTIQSVLVSLPKSRQCRTVRSRRRLFPEDCRKHVDICRFKAARTGASKLKRSRQSCWLFSARHRGKALSCCSRERLSFPDDFCLLPFRGSSAAYGFFTSAGSH